MEKINLKVSTSEVVLSQKEMLEEQLRFENSVVGDLNKEDGIDCPICLNRGYINLIDNNSVVWKYCECKKARKTINRLNKSGIGRNLLDRYTFNNFKTDLPYQKEIKNNALEYWNEINNNNNNNTWFIISGQSGSGKSHICTALFQNLVKKKNLLGEYFLWTQELSKLISLSESYSNESQTEFEKRFKLLEEADVLYIDDFLKQTNNPKAYNMAYKIINARYNTDKITIISCEYSFTELDKIDCAVAGRLNEKTDFQKYWLYISQGDDRNYRKSGGRQ